MESLGNTKFNNVYCANIDGAKDLVPLMACSPQTVRDAWIFAKYVKKSFVNFMWEMGNIVKETGKYKINILVRLPILAFCLLFFQNRYIFNS